MLSGFQVLYGLLFFPAEGHHEQKCFLHCEVQHGVWIWVYAGDYDYETKEKKTAKTNDWKE